ncbi:MAG TPA: AraC family transcriptional regulator [Gemmatimonadales bacterium]|nr:AraC family transcriptional regulator [Gemmatimonadales bacterium]
MLAVAALLDRGPALTALRRTLPRGSAAAVGTAAVACRSAAELCRLPARRMLDAVVTSPHRLGTAELADMRSRFPALPIILYAAFRPDDGALLLASCADGIAAIAVEGVDDPVVGDIVTSHSLTARRRAALSDGPRVLRLEDPFQRNVWDLLVAQVERPLRTADLARTLKVSREHLSRQFAAGGAPTLKRVIDLTRVAAAAQLSANPGYTAADVARLLGFTSASHLAATTRRIVGSGARSLDRIGPRGVLAAFARSRR